jgi:hypothetical protein
MRWKGLRNLAKISVETTFGHSTQNTAGDMFGHEEGRSS